MVVHVATHRQYTLRWPEQNEMKSNDVMEKKPCHHPNIESPNRENEDRTCKARAVLQQ